MLVSTWQIILRQGNFVVNVRPITHFHCTPELLYKNRFKAGMFKSQILMAAYDLDLRSVVVLQQDSCLSFMAEL
jgi:hypothetical protein